MELPDFANLKPVGEQPNLSALKPGVFQPTKLPPSTSPFNPNTQNNQFIDPNKPVPGTTTASKFVGSLGKAVVDTGVGIAQKTGQGYMDMTKGFGQDFQNLNKHSQAAVAAGDNPNSIKPVAKMGTDILSMGSHAIQGVFSPFAAVFQQGQEPLAEGLQSVPGFDKLANGPVGNTIDSLNQKASQLAQENPTKFKALSDAVNVIMGVVGEKVVPEAETAIKGRVNAGLDTVGNVANKVEGGMSNLADNIKTQTSNAIQDFKNVQAGKAEVKSNSLSGKITQGETADIPRAKDVLSNIDLTEVQRAPEGQKTQALKSTLDQRVKSQSEAIDKTLGTNKQSYRLSSMGEKVGDTMSNPVQDGINQLKEYYTNTKNATGLAKINALEQKANSQGLTLKEINNLAKEQGVAIDAYKANGDLASSQAKVAAENTRMGIKKTVDRLAGTDIFGQADAKLSDTIRVRDLIDKRVEAVTKLKQKIIEQPWYKKLGSKGAHLIDMLTGGNLKSAVNYFIPRGEGLKTLNALDLEKSLQKDLLKLQELSNTQSPAELQAKFNEYIKANENVEPSQSTKSIIKPAKLGQQKMSSAIKVNDYQSNFPKYFTPEQITRATEMLRAMENQGKTIDMKQIDVVVKKVKQMSDIKLNPGVKNNQRGNVIVKYKSAEEFVKAQGTPKTVQVWNKSKFSNEGAYADIPVIRKEENITLYHGGEQGQFWTSNKKYAEQFGNVKEKTGTFYKVDNGNRVTDVYVEAPTKPQLTDIWKKANKNSKLPKTK